MLKYKLANFYSKLLFGSLLVKSRMSGRRIPLMANLIITNKCNLKCFYCYVDGFNRQAQEIKADRLFQLIDTLYENGTRLIVLLGGEPLLYNKIDEVIDYIKNKNMVCEMITNGYFVENHINVLAKCDSVCVSLDGDEENHDLNRGKGSHKKALKAIQVLKEKGIPTRIKAVITRNNQASLDYLARFAKEKGLMMTVSTAATYDDRNYMQENKWLEEEEKRKFFEKLYSLKREGFPIGYSFDALNYIKNWPYPEDFIIKKNKSNHTGKFNPLRCKRKDNSLFVDADGYMYPCANQWGKNGKNIFTDGFAVAWENMVNYDCYACGSLPDIDITLMLNCNFENVLNATSFYSRIK